MIYKVTDKGCQVYSVGVNQNDDTKKSNSKNPPRNDDISFFIPVVK